MPERMKVLTGLFLSAIAGIVMSTSALQAQVSNAPEYDEMMSVKAGDVLEILPVTEQGDFTYAWIFTKNRIFIEAGREKIFRTRQVTPGDYLLDGAMTNSVTGAEYRRRFMVRVTERPIQTDVPENSDDWITQTVPPVVSERVYMADETQLLTITPNKKNATKFGLNLNPDRAELTTLLGTDNADTYSATDVTPLTLWFPTLSERAIEATIQKTDGTIVSQRILLSITNPDEPVLNQGGIVSMVQNHSPKNRKKKEMLLGKHKD
jgi:hypothetical protein